MTGISDLLQLPQTLPRDDPPSLWSLQLELLAIAESVLGTRDTSKKICQPQFRSGRPQVRHTANRDGAFVDLSLNAAGYWPTALYEMAHETVHLLNPTLLENSNNLEEGVSVAFSIAVQQRYQVERIQIPSEAPYVIALSLVRMLPRHPLISARLIREKIGAMSEASSDQLKELFPYVDENILDKLAEKFVKDEA